jgi:hypothetical protein
MDAQHDNPMKIVGLSPQDAQAVDHVLDGGAPGAPGDAPADARRVAKVRDVLALLDQWEAQQPPADLARRTMERINDVRNRRRFAEQAQALAGAPGAFRWSELIAVAAVLMIGLSVMWPVLSQMRDDARRVACATNLASAGGALRSYAADHAGMLPRGLIRPNDVWYRVGEPAAPNGFVRSQSKNLFLLVSAGYLPGDTLACPTNPNAELGLSPSRDDWSGPRGVSYSSQNNFRAQPLRIDAAPNLALLADKTPLINGSVFQRDLLSTSPSELHNRLGQNVLRANGAVRWTSEPVLDDDNIWLPRRIRIDELHGNEVPAGPDDAFLVP